MMKILWSVFVTFPEVADKIGRKPEYACTWARALSEHLRKEDNVSLAIVSIHDGTKIEKFEVNNVTFYFIPNGKSVKKDGGGIAARRAWSWIINDYQPDIIHIHGSETPVALELVRSNPTVPVFLTLQGIISNYYKDEYAGLSLKEIFLNHTLRDFVRLSGFIMDKQKTIRRCKYEQELLSSVHYLGGRTTWDKVSSLVWNPSADYMYSPEMIRPEFYNAKIWNVTNVKRHRIFMHQGFKPIKGLHILLDAIAQLKKKYPDVELYMSGANYMKNTTIKEKLLQPGYIKLLFDKIERLGLKDCIHFTGVLNAQQIIDMFYSSHVMVIPSSIENSPNSLVEAQLVGIPVVGSYVGGVPEMVHNNEDGLLYTFNEPLMQAECISQIFDSDELATKFSNNAYSNVRRINQPQLVINKTIENYKYIINDYKHAKK